MSAAEFAPQKTRNSLSKFSISQPGNRDQNKARYEKYTNNKW